MEVYCGKNYQILLKEPCHYLAAAEKVLNTSRFEAYRGSGGKAGNTAYSIQKIVNAGEGYKIGDILKFPNIKGVNISEGSNQDQFLLRVLDVTPPADEDETQNESDKEIDVVVMEDTGYGYEGFPYGDKGAAEEFGRIDVKLSS